MDYYYHDLSQLLENKYVSIYVLDYAIGNFNLRGLQRKISTTLDR